MSDILEVMARALCEDDFCGDAGAWDRLPETEAEAFRQHRAGENVSIAYRNDYRDEARAALAALEKEGYVVVWKEDVMEVIRLRAELDAMLSASPSGKLD